MEVNVANVITKAALTPARKRLIELIQEVNFGRIEGLKVRDGEPVIDPPPRVVREIKFGGENEPRRELKSTDFVLKSQAVELFSHINRMVNGNVEILEIKQGLPFRMSITESIRN